MTRHAAVASLLLAGLGGACERKPPQAPERALEPLPRIVETPKAPPRCEAIEERCEARSGKKARISGSTLVFEPVEGWIYAQGGTFTRAEAKGGEARFAVAGYDSGAREDPRKEAAKRDARIEALGRDLDVTLPKKIRWTNAEAVEVVGKLSVSLWEMDGAAHAGNRGTVLVFAAPIAEGKTLIGMAFVPERDSTGAADRILQSIRSISAGASSAEASR